MKKIILIGMVISSLNANNLDNFFENDIEVTSNVISEIEYKQKIKNDEVYKAQKNVKIILKENTPPKVYFKQPRVYTIYTREELRSFRNIDMVINSGWKTIIVGQHQLIINDEYKAK
jgi:hypothetical protein